ncbi:MAG: C40 family peptidase, partial [Burkholderiales bacterium]|nr:C40 family peptidase [Burkholderiales bacterium]
FMIFKKLKLLLLVIMTSSVMAVDATNANGDNDQTEAVAVNANSHDVIGDMLMQSINLIGIPYKWGGNTPQQGMDCSGFIRYVFKKSLGITLPRTAAEMARVGKRVELNDLEPGDLIFFNTRRGSNTHIGMYIGNNKFIQSPRTGETIQVTELTSSWRSKINGVKRIIQENLDDSGNTTIESYQDIVDEGLPVRSGYYVKRKVKHKKVMTSSSRKSAMKKSTRTKKSTTTKIRGKKKIR